MSKLFKVIKVLLIIAAILYTLYLVNEYLTHNLTFNDAFKKFMKYVVRYFIYYCIIKYGYHSFIEKYVFKAQRKLTHKVFKNSLGKDIAVIGPKGFGKDTLAVAIARYIGSSFRGDLRKKLMRIREKVYWFWFESLENYLLQETQVKKYQDKTKKEKELIFRKELSKHPEFIKAHFSKSIDFKQICENINLFLPSGYSFNDRVRDIDFFDLIVDYIENFYRIYNYTNFIISNEPMFESLTHVENISLIDKIKNLIEKSKSNIIDKPYIKEYDQPNLTDNGALKISYDYFKLKSYNSFSLINFLVIVDSEASLFYNNADKKLDMANKNDNGTLEFFIMLRQLLKDYLYITTIQEQGRAQAWYRGLFSTEITIQKPQKLVCTAPTRRFIIVFLMVYSKLLKRSLRLFKKKLGFIYKFLDLFLYKARRLHDRLYFKGFIQLDVVVHFRDSIEQKIRTRSLTRIIKSNDYTSFKTKFVIRILDSWPYYESEYFKFYGDELYRRSKVKFSQIPKWLTYQFTFNDAKHLNHDLLNKINKSFSKTNKEK